MNNFQKISIISLLLAFFSILHAGERSYLNQYLLSYPTTIEKGVSAPFHWETSSWITAGTIAVAGTALYLYDEDTNSRIYENRSHFTHETAQIGNVFGEGKYMFPAVATVWLGGYVLGSDKTKDTGSLMFKSMLFAGGTTTVLKYATQRNRPQALKGKELWSESGFTFHKDSFPSGHATIAFSMATVLAEQYKETHWVPIVAYTCATLTCYARMHDQKHWSSDVFTGAVIGYFAGQLVMKTTPRLSVSPSSDLKSVSFVYKF